MLNNVVQSLFMTLYNCIYIFKKLLYVACGRYKLRLIQFYGPLLVLSKEEILTIFLVFVSLLPWCPYRFINLY